MWDWRAGMARANGRQTGADGTWAAPVRLESSINSGTFVVPGPRVGSADRHLIHRFIWHGTCRCHGSGVVGASFDAAESVAVRGGSREDARTGRHEGREYRGDDPGLSLLSQAESRGRVAEERARVTSPVGGPKGQEAGAAPSLTNNSMKTGG